jgi:hypothetical protein
MWASLAISVMWLAVLFDALFGPDIVSNNATSTTRVPSAVVVALFAYLATRVTARYGFGLPRRDTVDQEHRNARTDQHREHELAGAYPSWRSRL